MIRRRLREDDDGGELNLVPIMNMVMCLIPVVLAGSAVMKVGVVNVNAPKFGPLSDAQISAPALDVVVALASDGFHIKSTADGAPLPVPALTKVDGAYDFAGLYNHMAALKQRYPQQTTIKLSADAGIPFKHLVATMDTLRVELDGEGFVTTAALRAAHPSYVDGQPKLLWPDVVFAVVE